MSEKLIDCFGAIRTITPSEEDFVDSEMEVEEIEKHINEFEKIISRNMPILPKELYDGLCDIVVIFRNQVLAYKTFFLDTEDETTNFMMQKEMNIKEIAAYDLLRQYYNSLEVT